MRAFHQESAGTVSRLAIHCLSPEADARHPLLKHTMNFQLATNSSNRRWVSSRRRKKEASKGRRLGFETLEARWILSAATLLTFTAEGSEPVSSLHAEVNPTDAAPQPTTLSGDGSATIIENNLITYPRLLFTQADFDRMAAKVAARAQPRQAGWQPQISDGYSQADTAPRPLATVIRGGDGQNFNQMVIDIQRTYQMAVRWKISGDTRYADQAVWFLNSWASTHTTLTGNADRYLASGLYGYGWAVAADIMRSYSGWAAADVAKFQNYLLNVYYPLQNRFLYGPGDHNDAYITNYWANWDLANIEGMMAVGIFCDRPDIYDRAIDYLYHGRGNGALDTM
jgi:hypothetical protein